MPCTYVFYETKLHIDLWQGLALIGRGGCETPRAGILGHGSSLPFTKGVRSEKRYGIKNVKMSKHCR